MTSPPPATSVLSKAGTVVTTVVKHVPTRAALWGAIGFLVGLACVLLSLLAGVLVMDRGALILGPLVAIPIAVPFLGAALFGMHGLHRGAARAALALEEKFGLVAHVVGRVLALLQQRFGEQLANLPLQQLEATIKQVVGSYLASKEEDEGRGLAAWVVRRARTAIALRLETSLLAAYREEQTQDGQGGGVSLEKVRVRVTQELSARLKGLVMSPLNRQLALFMTLYLLLAGGWWFWVFLAVSGVSRLVGHAGA